MAKLKEVTTDEKHIIDEDIKSGTFKRVYLIYGDESFLVRSYTKRLISAICDDETGLNAHFLEGRKKDIDNIINLAEALPFMAEYKLLVIENVELFSGDCDKLVDYIDKIPETTVIIFRERRQNIIRKNGVLYKAIKKYGACIEIGSQDETYIRKWIVGYLAKNGKKIQGTEYQIVVDRCGNDIENIKNELDKLIAYMGDREAIKKEDVEEIITRKLSDRAFEFADAIVGKNTSKAMGIYYELSELKSSMRGILGLVTKRFIAVYEVKLLLDKRYDRSRIARITGKTEFYIGKLIEVARKSETMELRNIIEASTQLLVDMNTGIINDTVGIEMHIINIASGVFEPRRG